MCKSKSTIDHFISPHTNTKPQPKNSTNRSIYDNDNTRNGSNLLALQLAQITRFKRLNESNAVQ